jgi:hypothetical protein
MNQVGSEEITIHLKDIFLENNYKEILQDQVMVLAGEEIIVLATNTLLLRSKKSPTMVLVECSHQGDMGVWFTFKPAHRQEIVLKYLLGEYQILDYTITDKVGGRSVAHGELLLVDPAGVRFIHDQSDFNKIGYTIRQKVESIKTE